MTDGIWLISRSSGEGLASLISFIIGMQHEAGID